MQIIDQGALDALSAHLDATWGAARAALTSPTLTLPLNPRAKSVEWVAMEARLRDLDRALVAAQTTRSSDDPDWAPQTLPDAERKPAVATPAGLAEGLRDTFGFASRQYGEGQRLIGLARAHLAELSAR